MKRKIKMDERKGRAAKRQHTSTFAAEKISSSSDEEEDYGKVIATLQKEVIDWKSRYQRLDTDWKQKHEELKSDSLTDRSQLVMVAKATKEIHGAIGHLVSHTSAASHLLKSVSKLLPEV